MRSGTIPTQVTQNGKIDPMIATNPTAQPDFFRGAKQEKQ
jgi:hypothetical protein